MSIDPNQLKSELNDELKDIMNYWIQNVPDKNNGGFYGRIDFKNKVDARSSKGIILNTRILWSFSACYKRYNSPELLALSGRSFKYLIKYFLDLDNGGLFWELNCKGHPINQRKQIYAQAFGIYAFSEYFSITNTLEAKDQAMALFRLIEKYARDQELGGYLEAFSNEWQPIEDVRLSDKDLNSVKTMNTHLHILEAYTTLLRITDDHEVKKALVDLIDLMNSQFLNEDYQFNLFFDKNWELRSHNVSFGHDIEAAWLILDAARQVEDDRIIETCERNAIKIADRFIDEGLDENGAVLNELNKETGTIDSDLHWWPQMEAMLGLSYVYSITQDQGYLDVASCIWEFTKNHIIDRANGEWHFRVDKEGKPYTEDKISMWKAPYHSSRACLYIMDIL